MVLCLVVPVYQWRLTGICFETCCRSLQVTVSQPASLEYFPEYSIFIFTAFLEAQIAAHAANKQPQGQKPLFIYAAFQNVHSPLMAPRRFFDLYRSQV